MNLIANHSEICRDELLFEIELEATAKKATRNAV